MKTIPGITIVLAVCIIMSGCKKDEKAIREWPRVTTSPVTDITEQGVKFNAEITYRGDFEILEYGFTWSQEINPNLETSEKVIITGNPVENKFSSLISTTLGNNVTNHVRAFVKTSAYTVYGKDVQFISLGSDAPKITSFSPQSASWGDTITIRGNNFSYMAENNIVKLGDIEAGKVTVSDTLISIVIPDKVNQNSVKISVTVLGNTAVSADNFNYLIPSITSISPITGTFLDTVTINGTNFGKSISYNKVFIGDEINEAEIISAGPSKLVVVIPLTIPFAQNYITVRSVGYKLVYDEPFLQAQIKIDSFEPDTVFRPDEIIDIYGSNFNPVALNNLVQIDGHNAEILEASPVHLRIRFPSSAIPNYNVSLFRDASLTVTAGSLSSAASESLNIHWESTWTRKSDFPGAARQEAVGFSAGGKGYFGTGYVYSGSAYFNDFWEYDPAGDTWKQIADFPGPPRAAAVAFETGGKGYVGTGSDKYTGIESSQDMNHFKDFYSYDPNTSSWLRIADFQGIGRHSAACFVVNNEGYVGTGHWGNDNPQSGMQVADDMWKYSPLSDTWTEIQKVPVSTGFGTGFSVNNTGYIFIYDDLYKYDGVNWAASGRVLLESLGGNVSFSINDRGYFGLCESHQGGTNALWEYNPATQSFANYPMDYADGRFGASAFVIGNKAYIIGGTSADGSRILNDVWEFDPSKPAIK